MRSTLPLEICVDSRDGLAAALAGGADRIELCSALSEGGLTPGPGLIMAAMECPLPVHAMIRPRGGDFVLRPGDLEDMLADINAVRRAGLAGVVIGVSDPDGALDEAALRKMIDAASGLHITLHRVFDLVPDVFAALELAIDLGMQRILTSGQAAKAGDGAPLLKKLVETAERRIEIMAGGGVTPANAPDLIAAGVDALHASCSDTDPDDRDCALLGIVPRRVTRAANVAALKSTIESAAQACPKPPLTENRKACA